MEEVKHYEKKIFDLRQLLEISRALNSTLDYQYLIQAVLDMCLAQAQTLTAGLFLTPEMDAEVLLPVNSSKGIDLPQEMMSNYSIPITAPFIAHIERGKHTLTITDLEKLCSDDDGYTKMFQRLGAELLVGMITRGKILGLIFLGDKLTKEAYSSEERDFLTDLASLSGIAVSNARLYERATTDQMTSLKNHAYFQSALREEREKANKRKTELAIFFADVDKFKDFNDTYGHQAGDLVLQSVAKSLEKSIRKGDLAARYGGEEFCAILPGTNKESALRIAERFRKAVEEMEVKHKNKKLHITTSVGVATFEPTTDHRHNSFFIERADKALYACKKNGRNQVQSYHPKMDSADN